MSGTWSRRHPDAVARYPVTFSLDIISCRLALLHPSVSSPVSALTHLRGQGGNRGNRNRAHREYFSKTVFIQFVRIEPVLPGSIRNFEKNRCFHRNSAFTLAGCEWLRGQSPCVCRAPGRVPSHVSLFEYRDMYGQAQFCSKGHQGSTIVRHSQPSFCAQVLA